MVRCGGCGDQRLMNRSARSFQCPECRYKSPPERARWRYIVHEVGPIRQLAAAGPQAGSEKAKSKMNNLTSGREAVRSIAPPGTSDETCVQAGTATPVYYLEGDERAAMRTFVETNREYVSALLDADSNRLAQRWPDWQYELLLETWWAIEEPDHE